MHSDFQQLLDEPEHINHDGITSDSPSVSLAFQPIFDKCSKRYYVFRTLFSLRPDSMTVSKKSLKRNFLQTTFYKPNMFFCIFMVHLAVHSALHCLALLVMSFQLKHRGNIRTSALWSFLSLHDFPMKHHLLIVLQTLVLSNMT